MNVELKKLKEVLDYDQETGLFTWKTKRWRTKAGDIAGTLSTKGYWQIKVFQKIYEAHRLAWYFVYGTWAKHELDHINCNKVDNRISNLRPATRTQNLANTRMKSFNKVGFKGVVLQNNKYAAQITHNYKSIRIGVFDTPEAAHKAYMVKAIELRGEYARSC